MTNEEMERAIDFLLKSQANFEARLAQDTASFNARLAQEAADFKARLEQSEASSKAQMEQHNQRMTDLDMRLGVFADMQADMIRVMTRTFDAQVQINDTVKSAIAQLTESQARTDRRLDALIDIVRRERNGE